MRDQKSRKERAKRRTLILYFIVLLSFIGPIVYLTYRMITGTLQTGGEHPTETDYTLMLLECILGLAVIHIPMILSRRFKLEIPLFLHALYLIFLYASIFLGEVCSFYYRVRHWDMILHAMSSVMTGIFGFIVISTLNKDEHVFVKLSPAFMALFAFCFSVTVGALWEIYEFTADGVFHTNMQKFITASGEVLAGHEAIVDTMKDIIVDVAGALLASVVGYFYFLKRLRTVSEEAQHEA